MTYNYTEIGNLLGNFLTQFLIVVILENTQHEKDVCRTKEKTYNCNMFSQKLLHKSKHVH